MNARPRRLHGATTEGARQRRTARKRYTPAPPKALPNLAVSWVLFTPAAADAYIGPGAGLSAIGSLLALLGAVLLLIVGFIWYPVKRVMQRRKAARRAQAHTEAESPAQE